MKSLSDYIYYSDYAGVLYCGDNREIIKNIPDNSIDSIVTDPPYELGFMGKHWDSTGIAYDVELWKECLRVLKPGGYLLSFGGSRTYHRMACAIEDAGFEIRDMIEWVYGSGFPKSLNIGNGWGTALKPSHEPICMARKPLSEKTVAENCLKWGTGGINVDGCRIGFDKHINHGKESGNFQPTSGNTLKDYHEVSGRFPANLIHDGSDEVMEIFPQTKSGYMNQEVKGRPACNTFGKEYDRHCETIGDSGSAARFFYCAKASKSERNAGCEGLNNEKFVAGNYSQSPVCKTCELTLNGTNDHSKCSGEVYYRNMDSKQTFNNHPTVKPIALMSYLCRLVTPKSGTVLDLFSGSGTTLLSARREHFKYIGIELNEEYCAIAKRRLEGTDEQYEMEFKND